MVLTAGNSCSSGGLRISAQSVRVHQNNPVGHLRSGYRGRSVLSANIGVVADFVAALGRAVALIKRESPDVVVGTGGFGPFCRLLERTFI